MLGCTNISPSSMAKSERVAISTNEGTFEENEGAMFSMPLSPDYVGMSLRQMKRLCSVYAPIKTVATARADTRLNEICCNIIIHTEAN